MELNLFGVILLLFSFNQHVHTESLEFKMTFLSKKNTQLHTYTILGESLRKKAAF